MTDEVVVRLTWLELRYRTVRRIQRWANRRELILRDRFLRKGKRW